MLLFACGQDKLNDESPSLDSSLKPAQRVITLAPHLTELLFSLGVQDRIIATVEYSDYPDLANKIPRIGDAFRIDWELLAKLKPDLVLAWEGGNPQNVILELRRRGYQVEAFPNASLFELPQQLEELSSLFNVSVQGVGEDYTQGLLALQRKYKNRTNIDVFYQVSSQPIYSIGSKHTISEMLQVCGAKNVFSDYPELASPLSPEAILEANPDVILTGKNSYSNIRKSWQKIQSISAANILQVSGDEVSRASLRMLEGTKSICETLDAWRNNQGVTKNH